MKHCVFFAFAIIWATFSPTISKGGPLHTQATPISGVTTFNDLYSGTVVDLSGGLKSAGGSGLSVLNISGYDAKLFASSSQLQSGMNIEIINGQSALLHAYNINPNTNLGSLQISANDKSYFDLKGVDITIDSFSVGTSQKVRLTGYRNGVIVAGALTEKTIIASTAGGLLVHFDVSALPAFKGITSFSIQTDGTYNFKKGIGVDNIDASSFRSVLPVSLISYDALLQKDNTVLLKWTTASETNNAYFLIHKSNTGADYSQLAKVEGDAASVNLINYQFTDNNPSTGNNFYRLTQVDLDGRQKILSIKKVFVKPAGWLSLYPNPVVNNSVTLDYGAAVSSPVSYKLVDISGKVVSSGKIHQQSQSISLPVLSAGFYTIQLQDGRSIKFEKK